MQRSLASLMAIATEGQGRLRQELKLICKVKLEIMLMSWRLLVVCSSAVTTTSLSLADPVGVVSGVGSIGVSVAGGIKVAGGVGLSI